MATLKLESIIPPEIDEARLLTRWVRFSERKYPELSTWYRIPNEAIRTPQLGAQLKRTGSKKGMPDYCLPVPKNGYAALYVELKRREGGTINESQQSVHDLLRYWGNKVVVAQGWEAAKNAILDYLENSHEAEH